MKAYGAGLLSSFGELDYSLSDKPLRLPFDPKQVSTTKYPITSYQPVYFVTESFKGMKAQVREYAQSMKRPFVVRYNALTQSMEVLDSKDKVLRFANNLQADLARLMTAVEKV